MAEGVDAGKATRDRSPGFPCISLQAAIEKLTEFEKMYSRHQIPVNKIGAVWGLKEGSSQVSSGLAALKYFGLLQYEGGGASRKAFVTEEARTFLRAQQESFKKMMLRRFALNPKEIAKFWEKWGCNRPPDVVCEDTLVLENAYNPKATPLFLRVYDETIAFAGLNDVEADAEDKGSLSTEESDNSGLPTTGCSDVAPEKGLHSQQKNKLGQGERELSTGLLSKSASFRLLVTGVVGKKEIDRLIMKLELDRDILAEPDEEEGNVLDLETMMQT